MELAKKGFLVLYWLILLACCGYTFNEQQSVAYIFSILLMPVLLIYMLLHLKPTHSKTLRLYFFLAILFAWVGDIFKPSTLFNYALLSLAGYGLANLLYALSFNKIRPLKLSKAVLPSVVTIVCILTIFGVFHFLIRRLAGSLYYPYRIYLITISIAAVFATNIVDSNTRKKLATNYFLPAIGMSMVAAILYMFNKHKFFEPKIDVIVLLMYGYSQMVLVDGFRKTAK